jgi:hypothetical protein
MNFKIKTTAANLYEAFENLKDELKEPRLKTERVVNWVISGNASGSFNNCPPGYDNEGNSTPNHNF